MYASFYMQLYIFVISLLTGFIVTFLYDFIIVIRSFLKHPKWVISLQDILYWMSVSIFFFFILFDKTNGEVRVSLVLAVFLGMFLYKMSLGKFVILFLTKTMDKIIEIVIFILQIIIFPLKMLVRVLKYPYHKIKLYFYKVKLYGGRKKNNAKRLMFSFFRQLKIIFKKH